MEISTESDKESYRDIESGIKKITTNKIKTNEIVYLGQAEYKNKTKNALNSVKVGFNNFVLAGNWQRNQYSNH